MLDSLQTSSSQQNASALPRARGEIRLHVRQDGATSRIEDLHQSGSLKLLFPKGRGPLTAVMLNTAGGVTGGDKFSAKFALANKTTLSVTTQAAERIYAATGAQFGEINAHVTVDEGARLNWLPQETILFDRSNLRRHLEIELANTAEALVVEPLVFGRQAMGETLNVVSVFDRIVLRRGGKLIYQDALRLTDCKTFTRPGGLKEAGAIATVLLAANDAETRIGRYRAVLTDAFAGASCLAPNLMIARLMAPDSFTLRRHLIPLLKEALQTDLPKHWNM